MAKQLCEGVPVSEQYHVTGTHHWKALNVLFQTTTKPHEANHRKLRYSALKIGQKLCHSAGQNLIRKLTAPPDDFFTPFQQLKRPANGSHPQPQIWQPKGSKSGKTNFTPIQLLKGFKMEKQTSALFSDQTVTDQ
ncbi:hypothetical protein RhiirA5_380280 [Rhizophagus irregularis]|uniref:Uncharacterized protein n=1 Tax=Rhizophagus irregularis TaxID=588596 RepID=A0A2N0P8Z9_9GLOM|nr:hypothetical protein RhiirA5_380280 [Rhizophagus irregularis]